MKSINHGNGAREALIKCGLSGKVVDGLLALLWIEGLKISPLRRRREILEHNYPRSLSKGRN